MNNRLFHGWYSVFLMICILSIGMISITMQSSISAFFYSIVLFAGIVLILFSFCSKCPCREKTCRHILFGPVAGKLFKRQEGAYTFSDIMVTTIGVSLIAIFPQFWLIKMPGLMLLFWAVSLLLVIEIRINICKTCDNTFCPGVVTKKE